ncbi:WD40-repeat-containing domain protein [Powellomyces hirtus]|nr:WD40-repeat-containing domain protein [Powellomyces hirtus]
MGPSYLQLQDPTLERSFRGHKDVITSVSFKPSMTQLASGSMDHSVMVWNFKPQLRAFRFVGHKGPVTNVDFSPSGALLASSSRDQTVRLWTPNVKGDVTVFKAHTSSVRTVQFSHDGSSLLTSSDDKTIKVWSTHRTKFQHTLSGHLNWVRTAKWSPDSRMIVSGSDDKTVKLWDLSSKNCLKTYWDHTGMVSSVAFHPGGTVVASASTDRSIKLFDIRTHRLIQHYGDAHGAAQPDQGSGAGVHSIAFGGPAGEWLISTGWDGVVKIWDVKEGHLFYTLHGHKNGPTTAATFSPQGDYFATGGSDSQVMVWKSNFDSIARMVEEDERAKEQAASQRRKSPHSHSQPVYQHTLYTEPTRTRTSSPLRPALPPKTASGGIATHRKQTESATTHPPPAPAIVDVGTSIFAEQDLEERVAAPPTGSTRTSPIKRGMAIPASHPQDQPSFSAPLEVRTIPDELASTLQHIVRQVDVLTQTMSILESRLTMNEDRVVDMSQRFGEAVDRIEWMASKLASSNSTGTAGNPAHMENSNPPPSSSNAVAGEAS